MPTKASDMQLQNQASSDYVNPVFTDKDPSTYQELNQPPNTTTKNDSEYEVPQDVHGGDYYDI